MILSDERCNARYVPHVDKELRDKQWKESVDKLYDEIYPYEDCLICPEHNGVEDKPQMYCKRKGIELKLIKVGRDEMGIDRKECPMLNNKERLFFIVFKK